MTQIDQQNVPKLRFPEFEGAWEVVPLSDRVASIKSGRTKHAEEGDVPVYGSTGLIGFADKAEFEGQNLLVARVGANAGQLNRADGRYGVTDNTLVVTPTEQIDLGFLESSLRLFNLNRLVFGSGQPLVTGTMLKRLKRAFPTLPEQRKIAGFLGAVDTKIAQLAEKKRLLEDYKKGCMQQLFSQEIRFKADTSNDFPNWEEKRLSDVFSWINTNSLSRERLTYDGGQVQNIHYGDIHTKFAANFHQDAEPVPYVKDATLEDFKPEQFCKVGDVVIADASEDHADIGKAIEIVSLGDTPLVAGLHTYIARPKLATVQTGFAGYLLRSAPMRRQIERIAQGISVLGISKGNLEKLTFFLPHPDEQRKIADFLSALDRKIDLVGRELTHARSFKQGLLQQMFV